MKKTIDTRELKEFALMMSWATPLFFFIVVPWMIGYERDWWPLVLSAGFLSLYFIRPELILYPYKFWMFFGSKVGWLNTRIILGFTFYVLIVPLGLLLRLFGKLQYKNKEDHTQKSYYKSRQQSLKREDLEQPF